MIRERSSPSFILDGVLCAMDDDRHHSGTPLQWRKVSPGSLAEQCLFRTRDSIFTKPERGGLPAMTEKKTTARVKLLEEAKTMLIFFLYLFLFFSAFTIYGRLMLAEYGIAYMQYGYNFIEAMVLAKVILLGQFLRLGERFHDRPLIVPTLYKTLWFSGLIFAFSIVEHLISGWLHGKTSSLVLKEILDAGLPLILAHTLVKVLALIPLFAVIELGRVVGEGNLFELFFKGKTSVNLDSTK